MLNGLNRRLNSPGNYLCQSQQLVSSITFNLKTTLDTVDKYRSFRGQIENYIKKRSRPVLTVRNDRTGPPH